MAEALNPTTERANIRFLYADMVFIALAFAMEWYYLQVYAIHLGATALQLGVLNSGRALLLVVGSTLSNRWQRQFGNAIRALRVPSLAYKILLYLAIAFVPLLPDRQVDALVALVIISAIPTGIAQGIFLGMMPFAVNKDNLARVVSQRGVLMNAMVLVCVFLLGQFLEWLPRPANYQAGFVLAFVVSFCSWSAIQRIKIPNVVNVAAVTRPINVWKFVPFRRFALVIFVLNTSVFMAAPLIPLQLVNGLNASDAWISLLGIFEMAAGALLTFFTPRLIHRFGVRKLIIATTFGTVFNVLTLALTPTLPPYIIGTTIWGAGWFAVNILLYNRLVEIVPQEDVRQYAAMYQILLNVALFIGPLMGTFLIEGIMTLPAALLLIAGVRFLAAFLMWAVPIEPEIKPRTRAVEAIKAS